MIPKKEFTQKLKDLDREYSEKLRGAGIQLRKAAEELKGITITLKLPEDLSPESIERYVRETEGELLHKRWAIFSSDGFYNAVKIYRSWKDHQNEEFFRGEFFYDILVKEGYDPTGKRIALYDTDETWGRSSIVALGKVLKICDASFVSSLDEADTAIYFGRRYCDKREIGDKRFFPLQKITSKLQTDENMAALIFYNQVEVFVCAQEETKETLWKLAQKRKNIFMIPLGPNSRYTTFHTTG